MFDGSSGTSQYNTITFCVLSEVLGTLPTKIIIFDSKVAIDQNPILHVLVSLQSFFHFRMEDVLASSIGS